MRTSLWTLHSSLMFAASVVCLQAQTTTPTPVTASDEIVQLPAFTVATGRDTGYVGKQALSTMRAGIPLLDTAQSVVVLNRNFLTDVNPSILADALRYVGGAQQGNINFSVDRYVLRGFASEGDYRDGFRVYTDANADMADVDHLEVVKGPAAIFIANSGQTGGQPVGGVINKVSKAPTDYKVGTLTLQTGVYDGNRAEFDVGGPVKGGLSYRVIVAGQYAQSYYDDTYVHRILIEPSLAYRFGPDTQILFRYNHTNNHFSSYNGLPFDQRTGTILAVDPKTNFDVGGYNWRHDSVNRAMLEFTSKLNDFVAMRLAAFTENTVASRVEDSPNNVQPFAGAPLFTMNPGSPAADTTVVNGAPVLQGGIPLDFVNGEGLLARSTTAQTNEYRNSVIQNDYVVTAKLGPISSRLIAGLEYIDQPTRNISYAAVSNPAYTIAGSAQSAQPINPFNSSTFGGAVAVNYTKPSSQINTSVQTGKIYALETVGFLKDRVQLTGGAIRTFTTASVVNELTNTTTLVPQTVWKNLAQYNALVKVTGNVSLFYGYSQNFSASAGTVTAANTLLPSFGQQKEAGLKTEGLFDGKLTLSTAYFQLSQTNLTVPAFPQTSPPSYLVVPGESSHGFDGDAYLNLAPNIDVMGSFAWFKAVDEVIVNGAPIFGPVDNVAERSASLWVRYAVKSGALRGFSVSLGETYLAHRAITNNANNVWYGYIPSNLITNLALVYDTKHFRYALNVENLFNKHYVADVRSVNLLIPGETANVKLSVTYKFQ